MNNSNFSLLTQVLQEQLNIGWQQFNESAQFEILRDFAFFLEASPEFQNKHRGKLPHPAHEYAARHIGKPFMSQLTRLGLHLDCWFPGNFEVSCETDKDLFEQSENVALESEHEIAVRVFFSHLIASGGRDICKISISFPHLHDSFGFPVPPRLKVVEVFDPSFSLPLAVETPLR